MTGSDLAAARVRATLARAELQSVVRDLQSRLRPANLAEEAMDGIKRKGEAVADDTVAAIRQRPVAAASIGAGVGALLGAAFLIRRRSGRNGDRS